MGEWPEFFVVGLPLVGLGIGLILWQRRVDASVSGASDSERVFLENRSRRRMQVAILIGLVGLLMIACGLIDPKDQLIVWWTLVTLILAFGLWIGVLALADLVSTRTVIRREVADIAVRRAALEEELRRVRPEAGADDRSRGAGP